MAMMGGRRIPALVVAAALAVPRHCGGQQVQPARPDEARAVVLAAEGVPDLELVYAGLDVTVRRPELSVCDWPIHLFRSADPRAAGVWYGVDPYSRCIVVRTCESNGPDVLGTSFTGDVAAMLPVADMLGIAREYIGHHDRDWKSDEYEAMVSLPGATGNLLEAGGYPKYDPYVAVDFSRRHDDLSHIGIRPRDYVSVLIRSTTGGVWKFMRNALRDVPGWLTGIDQEAASRVAVGAAKTLGVGYAEALTAQRVFQGTPKWEPFYEPCWAVRVGWIREVAAQATREVAWDGALSVLVHAVTAEVLSVDVVPLPGEQVAKVDDERLADFAAVALPGQPWQIDIRGSRAWALIYPRPHVDQAGRLFVPSWFAWLMGVRIEEDEAGFVLRGVRTVRRAKDAARVIDGEAWLPLTAVAAAAEATVDWEPDQRRLHIGPTWPRYQPAPEERSPREIDDGVGELAR